MTSISTLLPSTEVLTSEVFSAAKGAIVASRYLTESINAHVGLQGIETGLATML